jgi:hypothetical protein
MEKEWWASWWRWSLYFTWHFPLSSFKSSPMLSVLPSVEELELLVIPYYYVFENHLHFLSLWLICPSTSSYYHQAMVPILRHIVITDFHPVVIAASSSTVFLLLPEHNMYWSTPPSWSLRLEVFVLKSFRAPCHASLVFKSHYQPHEHGGNGILLNRTWHGLFRNL